MKIKLVSSSAVFLAIILLSGCVTKPGAIDDVYLSEISREDAEKLRKIEEDIVVLKKEKDKAEADLAIAEQIIAVSEAEIAMIEKKNIYMQEREKLYSITEDNQKLSREQENMAKGAKDLEKAKADLRLNEALRDEAEALLELKKAELSVKVAELDYGRARAAREYQSKRPEKFDKEKIIDDAEYEKFLSKQITDLDKKVENHRKAGETVEKIKSGKEVQK